MDGRVRPAARRLPGAGSSRRRGARHRGWLPVVALAAVLLLVPAGGAAQSGLLVIGGPEAGTVAASVAWGHGPVHGEAVGPDGWSGALDRGVNRLTAEGATDVVVVPLGVRSDAIEGVVRRRAGGVEVVVTPAVGPRRDRSAAATADRVLEEASAVLARLRASGPTSPGRIFHLSALNVTATRTPLELFGTAAPVSVARELALEKGGIGPLEPLATLPGVELSGVGGLRRQPVIRGFTGQRVLLLEDGLRLGNSRRRLDSTEPASLAGALALERIEVVRGPASVLYGSEAIGGVVNLVTRKAPTDDPSGVSGTVRASGSTAGDGRALTGDVAGTTGSLAIRVTGGLRRSGAYRAPGGTFGDVRLPEEVTVHDTGMEDRHLRVDGVVEEVLGGALRLRGEMHRAEKSGFGFVDPLLLGDDPTRVRITVPSQRYRRAVASWRSSAPLAQGLDAVDVSLHVQDNRRTFVTDVRAPLGGGAPTDARLEVVRRSWTDVASVGVRAELTTRLGDGHLLTWGVDAHRERATGTDSTTTTLRGMGPPSSTERADTAMPDATLRSVALFLQDRWAAAPETDVTVGLRGQTVEARPESVRDPGSGAHTDATVVASLGVVHRLDRRVALVASLARGFRSPNLVERLYAGPTPGGRGFWIRNPDLEAETSVNLDLGVRLRTRTVESELFLYRTRLDHGIRLEPTGRVVEGVPEYRNENVEALVVRGVEAWAAWSPSPALELATTLELHDRVNPGDPSDPLVEGVRERVGASLRVLPLPSLALRWTSVWRGAHGESPTGAGSPVGERIPSYHVHGLRARVDLGGRGHLALGVENLFDRLHARTWNAGFFRPEPGRSWTVSLEVGF